jgi:hypothetical protein
LTLVDLPGLTKVRLQECEKFAGYANSPLRSPSETSHQISRNRHETSSPSI